MSKYQEALDRFKAYKNICTHSRFDEDIDTLQELVNNNEKLEIALNIACEELSNGSRSKEQWKKLILSEVKDDDR